MLALGVSVGKTGINEELNCPAVTPLAVAHVCRAQFERFSVI